jgi:hypothetical protein
MKPSRSAIDIEILRDPEIQKGNCNAIGSRPKPNRGENEAVRQCLAVQRRPHPQTPFVLRELCHNQAGFLQIEAFIQLVARAIDRLGFLARRGWEQQDRDPVAIHQL